MFPIVGNLWIIGVRCQKFWFNARNKNDRSGSIVSSALMEPCPLLVKADIGSISSSEIPESANSAQQSFANPTSRAPNHPPPPLTPPPLTPLARRMSRPQLVLTVAVRIDLVLDRADRQRDDAHVPI